MAPQGAFISYRRADKAGSAHRLREHLLQYAPRLPVAMDAYDIAPGQDFEQRIAELIAGSAVMLVVIGPDWAGVVDGAGKRRIYDPMDLVRREIEIAGKEGCKIVPVLVEGASMPRADQVPAPLRPLLAHNAIEVRQDIFAEDVRRLLQIPEFRAFAGDRRRLVTVVAVFMAVAAATYLVSQRPTAPTASTEQPRSTAAPAPSNPSSIVIKAGRDANVGDVISGDKIVGGQGK